MTIAPASLPTDPHVVVPRELTPTDIGEICYNVNRKRHSTDNPLSPEFLTEIHGNIVHQAARYPLTAFVDPSHLGDLPQRCAEIKAWRETGLYTGTALLEMSQEPRFAHFDDTALRQAEEATLLEAATILARLPHDA